MKLYTNNKKKQINLYNKMTNYYSINEILFNKIKLLINKMKN